MPQKEETCETGRAYMVIGWLLVLFAVLVVFFEPAAARLGESIFGIIAATLVIVGLLLNIYGFRLRRRSY